MVDCNTILCFLSYCKILVRAWIMAWTGIILDLLNVFFFRMYPKQRRIHLLLEQINWFSWKKKKKFKRNEEKCVWCGNEWISLKLIYWKMRFFRNEWICLWLTFTICPFHCFRPEMIPLCLVTGGLPIPIS